MELNSRQNQTASDLFFWKNYPTLKRQILNCLCGLCECISCGLTTGFTGTLLPHIEEYVDEKRGPWIAGCNVLATPIGILIGNFVMHKFGRRLALVSPNIPWIVGWIILSTAYDFWAFFLGTALVGLSQGLCSTPIMVHAVEVIEPKLRGCLSSLVVTFFNIGVFVGHLFGIVYPWRISLALCATFPAVSLLLGFLLTESPNWLMTEGRVTEAQKSFFLLRGVNPQSQHEFDALVEKYEENATKSGKGISKNLFSAAFLRPLFITIVLFTIAIGCGADMFIYYGIDILSKMSKNFESEKVLTVINVVRIVAGILSAALIKRLRCRPLFFLSALSTIFFLIATMATINYKIDKLLIVNLCLYTAAANLGIVSIPWIVTSEIFPQSLRDIGSSLGTIYFYFLSFVLVELSPPITRIWGPSMLLCIFAGLSSASAILLYFIMPETAERTLQEVENKVLKKNFVKITTEV